MSTKIIKQTLALILLGSIVLFGCKKNEVETAIGGKMHKSLEAPQSDDEIILGDSIDDPYRIDNMRAAYDLLVNEGVTPPISSIEPNYRYVKVLPDDEEGLDNLEADTNLLLFDFPLHYEIVVNGVYYHDPTVLDSALNWFYAVVPSDYVFPTGNTVEDIYEVFIPEENTDFFNQLETKSYLLTGNLTDEEDISVDLAGSQQGNTRFIPSATIRVYDDVVGDYIPVQGAKVTARYCTKTASGITDATGYCTINKNFKYSVTYAVKWERAYWDIRKGALGQAYYNGPKTQNSWNLDISTGISSVIAITHCAAFKFYYGNCLGLRRPILNIGKTKIACYNQSFNWGSGCCWGTWSLLGVAPDIIVATSGVPTDYIFGTAIHELSHQSHLLYMGLSTYIQLAKEIHESWASAVEWKLTNHYYKDELGCIGYDYIYNYQTWHPGTKPGGKTDCYTPLFIDLMDDLNQRNNSSLYPNDMIFGYTLQYIQNNILSTTYGLTSFRTALKNHKINGTTDAQVDSLMALYWGQIYVR